MEVNTTNKILICDCSEPEIATAIEKYRVTVLEEVADTCPQH
jgi:hypothetical protein